MSAEKVTGTSEHKSKEVAMVASGLMPGLGHFYLGAPKKGMYLVMAALVIDAVFLPDILDLILGKVELTLNLYLGTIPSAFLRVWSVIDAEKVRTQNDPDDEKSSSRRK